MQMVVCFCSGPRVSGKEITQDKPNIHMLFIGKENDFLSLVFSDAVGMAVLFPLISVS